MMIDHDPADLGTILHTNLRKCCDSHPTSIVYHLVDLELARPAWRAYLAHLAREFPGTRSDGEPCAPADDRVALARRLERLTTRAFTGPSGAATAAAWVEEHRRRPVDRDRYNLAMAIGCAFRAFEPGDWLDLVGYLWDPETDPDPLEVGTAVCRIPPHPSFGLPAREAGTTHRIERMPARSGGEYIRVYDRDDQEYGITDPYLFARRFTRDQPTTDPARRPADPEPHRP